MKVGIDTFGLEHGKSGLGTCLLYLISNLQTDNKDLQIELFGSEEDRYTYTSQKPFNYISVKGPDGLFTERFWHLFNIKKFAKRNNYDYVIYPAVENVIPFSFNTKGIALVNSVISSCYKNMNFFYKIQLKHGLKKVSDIVAASEYIKQDLIKLGIKESKIKVIYNGIDHKMYFPVVGLDEDTIEIKPFAIKRPYFIYGSKLSTSDKKHIELIKAFELFKKNTNLPHRLVLAGSDGKYAEKVHEAAFNSEYSSDIFLTGYFPNESFPKLYAGSEALIFPAVNEGVCLPIIEAMATGVPVLCSDKGALKEIGKAAPLYFDSDNIDQMAECMQKIAEDKDLREKMISLGLIQSASFSWDNTVSKLIQLIMNNQ